MLKVIDGGKETLVAGAKAGDEVLIHLTSGKSDRVILNKIDKIGVEGFDINLISKPLTFYPYNNILKIVKCNNLNEGA